MGNHWTLQEAKKNLSAVVAAAKEGEPQQLTAPDGDTFVVLTAADFTRLTGQNLSPATSTQPTKSFVQHLLDFPKLPDDYQDLFDKTEPMILEMNPPIFDDRD